MAAGLTTLKVVGLTVLSIGLGSFAVHAADDPMRPYFGSVPKATVSTPRVRPLVLESTLINEQHRVAIINGYRFVIGERIRGQGHVRDIREQEVDIDWGDRIQTLTMTPSLVSNRHTPSEKRDEADTR